MLLSSCLQEALHTFPGLSHPGVCHPVAPKIPCANRQMDGISLRAFVDPSMWNWNKGFPSPALLVVLLTPTKLKDFSCGSRQSSLVSNHLIRMVSVLFSVMILNISESILKSVYFISIFFEDKHQRPKCPAVRRI